MSQTEPEPPVIQSPLQAVFVVNGTMTSAGPGPGVRYLLPAEASALIQARLAVAGDKPPRGQHGLGQKW
jgi:hypothetical protein